MDWIRESLPVALSDDADYASSSFAPRAADMESPGSLKARQSRNCEGRDDFVEEVAFQIASDRHGDFRERRSGEGLKHHTKTQRGQGILQGI